MSVLEIERMIYDLHRGGKRNDYDRDREAFLSNYALNAEENAAICNLDYSYLYDLGVNPMLCMYFARANNLSVPAYLASLTS